MSSDIAYKGGTQFALAKGPVGMFADFQPLLFPGYVEHHASLDSRLKQAVHNRGQTQVQPPRNERGPFTSNCRFRSARQDAKTMVIDMVAMAFVDRHVM